MLIQAYQESWIDDFNRIKGEIVTALTDLDIVVEHIGSTSVPGLAAKPIIDIDLVYTDTSSFADIRTRLEEIGYYHNGNQGIADREVFKREKGGAKHPVLDQIEHHLYVCPADSEELQRHLLFRDCLRADEAARIHYQRLKYIVADEAKQDRKRYAQLKEVSAREFIERVIERHKEQ